MNYDPYSYLNNLSTSDLMRLYQDTPHSQLKNILAAKITARQIIGGKGAQE